MSTSYVPLAQKLSYFAGCTTVEQRPSAGGGVQYSELLLVSWPATAVMLLDLTT
jgi:hypothetical protein